MALDPLIQQALAAVRADEQHHLGPSLRRRIYTVLEPIAETPSPVTPRRGRLGVLAARRALPVWEFITPLDDDLHWEHNIDRLPHKFLTLAENLLVGTGDIQAARTIAGDEWYFTGNIRGMLLEGRKYQTPHFHNASYALYAALLALNETLGTDALRSLSDEVDWHENDVDDYELDAAGAAMRAVSGVDMPDPQKRLEYWEWWLTEAVPSAYSGG
jgi:hypothetical protein